MQSLVMRHASLQCSGQVLLAMSAQIAVWIPLFPENSPIHHRERQAQKSVKVKIINTFPATTLCFFSSVIMTSQGSLPEFAQQCR
jgi:hypothetical protein